MTRYFTWFLTLALGLIFQAGAYAQTVPLGKSATLRAKTTNAQIYEWTFPGGIVINGEVVQYTFTEPGVQEVNLKVTDFEGNTNEITRKILVANDGRPTAIIETKVNGQILTGSVVEATMADTISFASASFAPEKSASDFTNVWSVNGRAYQDADLSTVFDKIGTYSVNLTVSDPLNGNQKDQAALTFRILNQPPVVSGVSLTPVGNSTEQVRVEAIAQDPDGQIVSYKFEALEAGRAVMTQVVENSSTVFDLSRFPGEHTYNFRVTVSDDRFLNTTYTDDKTVSVDPLLNNTPPEVELKISPGNQGFAGDPFRFEVEATDADQDALKYEWISSDGMRYSSTSFQKIYFNPGTYTMELRVTDGLESTVEKIDITILDTANTAATNREPEINISGVLPNTSGSSDQLFRFYLEAKDEDKDQLTYEWDFGNGMKSFTQNAAIFYSQPGEYKVEVSVSDGITTVTDSVVITVELGPKELYFESSEERLASLKSEQQQLQALIAANGGEITPEQQAQLDALNQEVRSFIREASANGDANSQTQLRMISASLTDTADAIRLGEVAGMDLEAFTVEMTETQQINLEALEASRVLAQQSAISREEAMNAALEAIEEEARLAELDQDTRQEEERSDLESSWSELGATMQIALDASRAEIERLEGLKEEAIAAGNTAAEASIQALIEAQTQIETDYEVLISAQNTRQSAEATDLETSRNELRGTMQIALDASRAEIERLEGLKEEAIAAGNTAAEASVQALIDTQTEIETKYEGLLLEQETLRESARTELETSRNELKATMEIAIQASQDEIERLEGLKEDAIEAGNEAAELSIQALIDAQTDIETEYEVLLSAQDTRQAGERTSLETSRNELKGTMQTAIDASQDEIDRLEGLKEDAIEAGNTAAEASVQALIDAQTAIVDEYEILLSEQEIRQAGEKTALETSRNELKDTMQTAIDASQDEIDRLEGLKEAAIDAGNTAAEASVQALIDAQTVIVDEYEVLLTAQETRQSGEAENLETSRNALKETMQAAIKQSQDEIDRLEGLKEEAIEAGNEAAGAQVDSLIVTQKAIEKKYSELLVAQELRQIQAREALEATRNDLQTDMQTALNKSLAERTRLQGLKDQAIIDGNLAAVAQVDSLIEAQEVIIKDHTESIRLQALRQEAARGSLETERTRLESAMKTAVANGDIAAAAQIQSLLDIQNTAIEKSNTLLTLQIDRQDAAKLALSTERGRLKEALKVAQNSNNTPAKNRIESQLTELTNIMAAAEKSAYESRLVLNQQQIDLSSERERLAALYQQALEDSDGAQVQRINKQLASIDAAIDQTNQALEEALAAAEDSRTTLANERAVLANEMNVALKTGDIRTQERIKAQLAQIEFITTSIDLGPNADYVEAQNAKFAAKQASHDLMLAEIEKAKSSGKTLDQLADRFDQQASLTNVDSEDFQSAALSIEQSDRINRSNFVESQITNLENLDSTSTVLPTLGVSRQSNETLPERLNRIEDEAQKAEAEAAQRQTAAAEIAALKQREKIAQVARLEVDLNQESDNARKAVISSRITVLKREIGELEQIKNPGSVLSKSDIEAQIETLLGTSDRLSATIASEQQEFVANRLSELQIEIDLASDPGVKSTLEAEKKRLEANLGQTDILTDYESQLKATQQALNVRLATNLNATAESLVQTQLNAVETKIKNLNELAQTQSEIDAKRIAASGGTAINSDLFLAQEKQALELELREINVTIARSDDPIEVRALRQREVEVKRLLATFPEKSVAQSSIDDLRITQVVDYLEHYFQVESQALDLDLDTNKAAEMNRIKAQILLLNQLNNYGYTPQTQLSTLMVDLQRRESELLDLFRASDGETAQDLRERLTVLAEAMEQIEGLEVYQIVLSDSVFRAQQKLAASIDAASQAYLTSSNGRERLMTREVLNSMRISERWLGRFYKPDERDMTLSELEAELTSGLTSDSSAEQIAQLAELKSIKANLDEAVKARLETDFENFKTNLQKQAKQVSDPDEKRMIEQRIKALQFEDFVDQVTVGKAEMFESLLADLTIKIDTNLFLYADIPLSEYPEPLLFEWDLGDGEKRFGQNVNHEYFEAGFYRVVLTMYDGVTSEQDLFTIRVIE